jgi:excisionase family DNA binding protein
MTSSKAGRSDRRRALPTAAVHGHATEPPSKLLDVAELAALLNVSPAWVRKGALTRTIPYTKIGRAVRFTSEQVAWIVTGGERPAVPRPRADDGRGSARTKL